jgi:hypothetical protein
MYIFGEATRDNKKIRPPVGGYLSHIQMVVGFMVEAKRDL